MDDFQFNDSTFQYLLTLSKDDRFSDHLNINNNYILNFTRETEVIYHTKNSMGLYIVGFCIDSHGEYSREDIPRFLCESVSSIDHLTKKIGRFAGKYVIVYRSEDDIYLLNDATASIPVYYSQEYLSFSSSEYILATHHGLNKDTVAEEINSLASTGMPLPYNLSNYNGVSFMLANHYISTEDIRPIRYFIPQWKREDMKYEAAVSRSLFLIRNIVKQYDMYYDLICPLTSGTDSRVVLSFLLEVTKPECYTFKHSFSDNSGELTVPRNICNDLGLGYEQIEVKIPSKDLIQSLSSVLGDVALEIDRVKLAYTIKNRYKNKNKTIITGDIIDQIGKSGTFGSTPSYMAFDSYFVSKTHSFSEESFNQTSNYIFKLKEEVHPNNLYDFFALEMRCGRWGSRSSEVYSSIGVNMLNIFNCTELIMLWFNIDRISRAKKNLLYDFLKFTNKELLQYPINPDDKFKWVKSNSYLYPLASYLKFIYQKRSYR